MFATVGPRVLLDATAVPENRGGVGRYVDQLIPSLDALGSDLVVVCQQRDTEYYGKLAPSADVVAAPTATERRPARLLWEQTGLPRLAERVGAEVLHCPHYTMPLRSSVPVVTTLHDATFFTHPTVHQPVKRSFFKGWTHASLRRAARCVVPSYATLDEISRVTGAVRDQVDVAHHGVDPATFHLPDPVCVEKVRQHLGLKAERYIAFLGTIEPRKNVPFLIEGWRRAVQGFDEPPALVVAGGRGWDTRVDEVAASVPERLELLLPGYLPLDMLSGFLGGAEAVVYPSMGEGFGLPVLEAMACGAPVITTTSLALPEVGGDAVAYTDPTAAGIASTLGKLLADGGARKELSAAAVTRAGSFTWTASAEQHLRTYARAVAA